MQNGDIKKITNPLVSAFPVKSHAADGSCCCGGQYPICFGNYQHPNLARFNPF